MTATDNAKEIAYTRVLRSAACGFFSGSLLPPGISYAWCSLIRGEPEYAAAILPWILGTFSLCGALLCLAVAFPQIERIHAGVLTVGVVLGITGVLGAAADATATEWLLLLVASTTAVAPSVVITWRIKRWLFSAHETADEH